MPKYTYKCAKCEKKFDVEASIKEREEGSCKFSCPSCKCSDTRQVFSLKSFFSKDDDGKGGNGGGGCCCDGKCGYQ